MTIKKRMLLWDYTNTQGVPQAIDKVPFNGPTASVVNWNAWSPPELKGRAPFRPMIHLLPQLLGNEWQMILNSTQSIVLYFNEPERNGISPEQAALLWSNQVMQLRSRGKKLCSPSCAGDERGAAWMERFMRLTQSYPPDFIGVHYYGTDVAQAKQYLNRVHAKYPRQPMMVTEIASISRNYSDVLRFTVEMANFMDQTPWIFEYGFFGCMRNVADNFVSPQAQLMNRDGSFKDLMYKLMHDQPMHT